MINESFDCALLMSEEAQRVSVEPVEEDGADELGLLSDMVDDWAGDFVREL